MKILTLFALVVLSLNVSSQDSLRVEDETFLITEVAPEFPGGSEKLYKKLSKEMKYPLYARRKGIQGRVSFEFVIGKTGVLESFKIIDGIGGGCDEELRRAFLEINKNVRWSPGKVNERPVKTKMGMSMTFAL